MSVLYSVLALAVTLGILVSVHEFGHFWVARRCGVKVLKFSVGFGKVIWSRTDKHGTEFALAAIPLGGYVKMLDEREAAVAPELLDQTFNRKTVWQRMAIVLAGPLANLIFAVLVYSFMFMVGITTVKPILGPIATDSSAANAQLQSMQEITAIDGQSVVSWQEVNYGLISRLGDTGNIELETDGSRVHSIAIERWLNDVEEPNPLTALGIEPYRPQIPAVLAQVQADMPAKQAGLLAEDQILKANGQEIKQWLEFVDVVKAHASRPITLSVQRAGEIKEIVLIPASRTLDNGDVIGFAGAMVKMPPLPENFITQQSYPIHTAFLKGVEKTWSMSIMTLDSLGKMLQGLLSVKNLSGPITIAKVANSQAQAGFEAFISFLAYISIMLAVVNLLPIPVLDGGHFLFFAIEAIKGSPISEKFQLMGMKLGMAMLMMVMFIAIFNDISRI